MLPHLMSIMEARNSTQNMAQQCSSSCILEDSIQYYSSAQLKTSMMANVSDCGELHDKLWKLSDIDELFAQIPFPDNEISVPELDNTLPATHSAMESAKVCYAGP